MIEFENLKTVMMIVILFSSISTSQCIPYYIYDYLVVVRCNLKINTFKKMNNSCNLDISFFFLGLVELILFASVTLRILSLHFD